MDKNELSKRELDRIGLLYSFCSSLHLVNYYAMEICDKSREGGSLLRQQERKNVVSLINTINRFNNMTWASTNSISRDNGETLVFENVSAGVELLSIAMQVPPTKIDTFIDEIVKLASKLTREAVDDLANGLINKQLEG